VGCWVVQGLTFHRTHYRSFQRGVFCKGFPSLLQVKRPNQQHQYTEGIIKLIGKKRTKYNTKNTNNLTVKHKLTVVQSPHTTLGQETKWAYSTTAPRPTRANSLCGPPLIQGHWDYVPAKIAGKRCRNTPVGTGAVAVLPFPGSSHKNTSLGISAI